MIEQARDFIVGDDARELDSIGEAQGDDLRVERLAVDAVPGDGQRRVRNELEQVGHRGDRDIKPLLRHEPSQAQDAWALRRCHRRVVGHRDGVGDHRRPPEDVRHQLDGFVEHRP